VEAPKVSEMQNSIADLDNERELISSIWEVDQGEVSFELPELTVCAKTSENAILSWSSAEVAGEDAVGKCEIFRIVETAENDRTTKMLWHRTFSLPASNQEVNSCHVLL
jgi:hypothetical protein